MVDTLFTRALHALLSDDEYRALQNQLLLNPLVGDAIKGGGGIRKMRFGIEGRGKSGGVRVIYFWLSEHDEIYMLLIYPKSKKDNLSADEVAMLRALVKTF